MIGQNVERKEAWEKVTGRAKYTADLIKPGTLSAYLVTSACAHAKLLRMDASAAEAAEGVVRVVTGEMDTANYGILIGDRPVIARGKVRYWGEPVAIVIAHTPSQAARAAKLVKVEYEPLPLADSLASALMPGAVLVHEGMNEYPVLQKDVQPTPDSNIVSSYKIRKGDMAAWASCAKVVERRFSLPNTAHAAMETHICEAEILPNGDVELVSATQAPYAVKQLLASVYDIEEGKVHVKAPLLGGGFGGKSSVHMEMMAYAASKAVSGRRVRLMNTREQEFMSSPDRFALEASVKMGASSEGKILACEMSFQLDCGAYADISPNKAKAMAADCTGPYNMPNLCCDALCVYTNHDYGTALRGFSHAESTFCVERTIDALAAALGMDALEFRRRNLIQPGDYSPTQIRISRSNAGDVSRCLERLSTLAAWEEAPHPQPNGRIRATGLACLWKMPNPLTNASAGAVITFNSDGSVNLITGAVEMGSAGQSMLCQMLAEKLRMKYERIHTKLETDTQTMPEYWKTVASLSNYLLGRAVMNAADDLLAQLRAAAAIALRADESDLDYGQERFYLKHAPEFAIGFQDIAFGVSFENGNAVGRQIVGRGGSVLSHLTMLSQNSGKGKTGQSWTVGAQAAEVEYDPKTHEYKVLRVITVMDVGRLIDPASTQSSINGGAAMGVGMATREAILYNADCVNETTSFRTYKMLRFGEQPEYIAQFVETPEEDSPYGTRSFSEHGIIGVPAAIGNAVSRAAGVELNMLPITPESIRIAKGEQA